MTFAEIYKNTPDRIKLKYLDTIIAHNDKLQKEFMAYAGADPDPNETEKPDYDAFAAAIKKLHSVYQNLFEEIDLENPDWDNYSPSHSGYIEEWQQYQEASEQEFQEYFQLFHSQAMDAIISQQPDELLAMLVGLYEAALDAEVHDEFDSFDDVNEFLLLEHEHVMLTIVEKLQISALSDNKAVAAFDLFFRYCIEEHPGNPHFAKHFEPILLTLAEKTDDAGRLLSMMKDAGIEQKVLPRLSLLLLKSDGNQDEWLQSAQKMYRQSEAVAKELLKYYFENDQAAFVKTAYELFPTNASYWAGFLNNYVTPQLDKSLFVKVFTQLLLKEHDLEHYRTVKPYLDEVTYKRIISELQWNKVFLVKLFAEDERYADIKALVEKEKYRWHFGELISPILSVYPDFCFKKIKAMVENSLAHERGRSIYERIAQWLLLARQIPGHEGDAMYLINKTYGHKPNLPALKDEMRRAGLK